MARNLVVVPTRGRGIEIRERLLNNLSRSQDSTFILAVDTSDRTDYSWASSLGIEVDEGDSSSMNEALNRVASKYAKDFNYISFLGDDHRVVTHGWDTALMANVSNLPLAVTFGDDLLSNPPLATFVMLDARIIRQLGYFSPPQLRHMFLDDYWMFLGKKLDTLRYFPEVQVAHDHFSSGRSPKDRTYMLTNRLDVNLADRLRFVLYRTFESKKALEKLAVALN